MKHPSLELMDERNKRLDELSKYIPIEVETFSEEYTSATPPTTRYRIYNYDSAGNVTGRSDWPEDIRVNLVYRDSTGGNTEIKKITLVNGSIDADLKDATGACNPRLTRTTVLGGQSFKYTAEVYRFQKESRYTGQLYYGYLEGSLCFR